MRRATATGAVLAALLAAGCGPPLAALETARADLRAARSAHDPERLAASVTALERLAMRRRRSALAAEARTEASRVLLEHLAASAFTRALGTDLPAVRSAAAALAGPDATPPFDAAIEARIRALGDRASLALLEAVNDRKATASAITRLRAASAAGAAVSTAAYLWLLARGAEALDGAMTAPLHADLVLAAEYPVFCPPGSADAAGSAVAARAMMVDSCLAACAAAQPDPSARRSLEFRKEIALAVCGHASLGLPAPGPGIPDLGSYLSDEALVVQRHLADLLRRTDTALRSGEPTLALVRPALEAMRARLLAVRVPLSYGFVTDLPPGPVLALPLGAPGAIIPFATHVVLAADGSIATGPRPTASIAPDGTLRFFDADLGEPFPGRPYVPAAAAVARAVLAPASGSAPASSSGPASGAVLLLAAATARGKPLRTALAAARASGATALLLGCATDLGPWHCSGGEAAFVSARAVPPRAVELGAGGQATLLFPGAAPFTIPGWFGAVSPEGLGAAVATLVADVPLGDTPDARTILVRLGGATTYADLLTTVQVLRAARLEPVLLPD